MHTIDVFTHFMPPRFLQKFQAWAPDAGMFRRSMQVKPLFEIDARLLLMDEFDDVDRLAASDPATTTYESYRNGFELFERKIRPENEDKAIQDADESWAEMLIEDEEEEEPSGWKYLACNTT